jgi:hypothetical protein
MNELQTKMEQRKEATGNIKLLTPRRIGPQLKGTIILEKELKFVLCRA